MSSDQGDERSWDTIQSTFQVSAVLGAIMVLVFEAGRQLRGGRTSAYGGNYVSFTLLPYGNRRKSSRYVDDPNGSEEMNVGPQLPERPWFPGGWLQPVIDVDGEQQLLDLVGLDAFVLLRFAKMQARIFCFCAFFGVVVLIPVYLGGSEEANDTFYRATMANMEQQSRRIWVATFMAFLFSFYAMFQIAREYADFVDLRHQYFLFGSRETSPQSRYTILVENIPRHLRTSAALMRYFDELFPGKVQCAVVALDTTNLARLMRRREQVANLLERYLLLDYFESDDAPHLMKPWGYYGGEERNAAIPADAAAASSRILTGKEPACERTTRLSRMLFCCERTQEVRAVEFLEQLLDLLNEDVIAIQQGYLDDATRADAIAKARLPLLSGLLFRVESELNKAINKPRDSLQRASDASGAPPPSDTSSARPSPTHGAPLSPGGHGDLEVGGTLHVPGRERTVSNVSNASSTGGARRAGPQLKLRQHASLRRQISDMVRSHSRDTALSSSQAGSPRGRSASDASMLQDNLLDQAYPAGGRTLSLEDPPMPGTAPTDDGGLSTNYGTLSTAAVPPIKEEDEPRTTSQKLRESVAAMFSGIGTTAVTGTAAVGRTGIHQMLNGAEFAVNGIVGGAGKTVAVLEALTVGSDASNTGFVTFRSLAAKETAHQALLTHADQKGRHMEVVSAPEPRDVIWPNVHFSQSELRKRRIVAGIAFGLLTIVFNIPIGFCVAATNEETLIKAFPGLESVKDEQWFDVTVAYLPTLAALGLVQLMPLIFLLSAQFYEHYKGNIEVQGVILSRFFNVQLAFVYVTVTAGSVTDAIFDILDRPSEILFILGNALPAQASYFMGFMIIKLFQGLTWELSRLHVFIPYLLTAKTNQKSMGEREILSRNDPRAFPYGWVYPALLVSTIVGFCFAVVCPLVSVVCCAYFFAVYVVYKHQLIFVYINASESGGAFFFPVFRRTITAMIAGQLTFGGYLAIKEAFAQATIALMLPLLTLAFAHTLQERYERPAQNLSFEQAAYVDRVLDSRRNEQEELLRSSTSDSPGRGDMDNSRSGRGPMAGRDETKEVGFRDLDVVDLGDEEYIDWRPGFKAATYLQPELRDLEPVRPLPSRWRK